MVFHSNIFDNLFFLKLILFFLINESLILLIIILILYRFLLNRKKWTITVWALLAIELFLNILSSTYHQEVALTSFTHHGGFSSFTVFLSEQLLIKLFENIWIVALIISIHEWRLNELSIIYSIVYLIYKIPIFMFLLFCVLVDLWVSFLYFLL